MPELPEVETTRKGIAPFLLNQTISQVIIRQSQLRLPIPANLNDLCSGKVLLDISRRAKYLLLHLTEGYLLIHLGMSGHLRIVESTSPAKKHDHLDLCFANNLTLRYHDPRRFGLLLYINDQPWQHRLLAHLGPEPLSLEFTGEYLHSRAKKRSQSIKSFIMTNEIIVGIGNIYAAESLFLSGIHPQTSAGALSLDQMNALVEHLKTVLQRAIVAGGTTLRDFYGIDGKPGYFSNTLNVYGRQNLPCYSCQTPIAAVTIAGRNSAFCPQCQPQATLNLKK